MSKIEALRIGLTDLRAVPFTCPAGNVRRGACRGGGFATVSA